MVPNITPIMENQMEKKMENEMETGELLSVLSFALAPLSTILDG